MPTYAIKSESGRVAECAFWSHDDAALPDGYHAASAEEYQAAKKAVMNSLPMQAMSALLAIRAEAYLTVAMGQTFGPAMRSHVMALAAIADGSDATAKELPMAPAKVTD